jgi:hypothetical protein
MAARSWPRCRIDGLEARGHETLQFMLDVGRAIGYVVEAGPVAG